MSTVGLALNRTVLSLSLGFDVKYRCTAFVLSKNTLIRPASLHSTGIKPTIYFSSVTYADFFLAYQAAD
jgi:hypothetical protein